MCEEIRKKLTKKIHPLKQVYIHNVKVLKRPKMDKARNNAHKKKKTTDAKPKDEENAEKQGGDDE